MNLKQLIEYLEKKDTNIVVPVGFDEPHSYRGACLCLAFEPARDVTIGAMLQCARNALGSTYKGWHDGVGHWMNRDTEVYLAMYGCLGEKIGIVLLDYMTGVYEDEEIKTLRGVINRSTDQIVGLKAEIGHLRTSLEFADDTIKDLNVEMDIIRKQLIYANRVILMFQGTTKEDDCRIDSLIKERNELNHLFLNDRDTLRSIERICAELGMRDPQFISRDVQAIKSMKKISNIMEGWDPDIGREKEFDAHLNEAIELLVGEISDQNKTIENKCATINWLEDRIDNQSRSRGKEIEELKTELASMVRDSEVFMEVVNVVRDWDDSTGRAFPTLYKIVDLLVDYTDIPEGQN